MRRVTCMFRGVRPSCRSLTFRAVQSCKDRLAIQSTSWTFQLSDLQNCRQPATYCSGGAVCARCSWPRILQKCVTTHTLSKVFPPFISFKNWLLWICSVHTFGPPRGIWTLAPVMVIAVIIDKTIAIRPYMNLFLFSDENVDDGLSKVSCSWKTTTSAVLFSINRVLRRKLQLTVLLTSRAEWS